MNWSEIEKSCGTKIHPGWKLVAISFPTWCIVFVGYAKRIHILIVGGFSLNVRPLVGSWSSVTSICLGWVEITKPQMLRVFKLGPTWIATVCFFKRAPPINQSISQSVSQSYSVNQGFRVMINFGVSMSTEAILHNILSKISAGPPKNAGLSYSAIKIN